MIRYSNGVSSSDRKLEDHHQQQRQPRLCGFESRSMMHSEMFNSQQGSDLLGTPSGLHEKHGTNDWYRQGALNPHPHLASLGVSRGNSAHYNDHDSSSNNDSHTNSYKHMSTRQVNNSSNGVGQHPMSSGNQDEASMQFFMMNREQLHPNFPHSMLFPASLDDLVPAAMHLNLQDGKFRNWEDGKISENQGLSLSISSLQNLDVTNHRGKPASAMVASDEGEELRMGGSIYYPPHAHQSGSYSLKGGIGINPIVGATVPLLQAHLGSNPMASVSIQSAMILRSSRFLRAAQELLEEFCNMGRGLVKSKKPAKQDNSNEGESSVCFSHPPLSSSERFEHQRKKTKLLSMLDEVDRRYSHYCEQMQQVATAFDEVMGIGAALPYTRLAEKAMSRHFRCLKDAIASQIKAMSDLLGEKDVSGQTGITKGETPRLRLLEKNLRQQRAFHQIGMMEQEPWRPQRGLPERSVNILRAWLFEHFLHPYPTDPDKHLLSRQTGLSRNQVSNWFINARVRLWKPMVEEMYQEEAKDGIAVSAATAAAVSPGSKRCDANTAESNLTSNPSEPVINKRADLAATRVRCIRDSANNGGRTDHQDHTFPETTNNAEILFPDHSPLVANPDSLDFGDPEFEPVLAMPVGYVPSAHVSLSLGLRHPGGLPNHGRFSEGRPGF